jgi:hypothetical protein
MTKKVIALIGLWNSPNYGDPVLAFCTKKLFQDAFCYHDFTEYKEISLCPDLQIPLRKRFWSAILYRISILVGKKEIVGKRIYAKRLLNYYTEQLTDVDTVVFVGGGVIKYRRIESYDCAIESIMKITCLKKIPVAMSSVGVEGFDLNNMGCLSLKTSLRRPSLKYISTRDDLSTLINGYFDGDPSVPCELVADPAVWSSECFNVQRDGSSVTIGIGIARGEIFSDYDKNFSSDSLLKFYINLIGLFLNKGFKIELFTNGLEADKEFVGRIMAYLSNANITQRNPTSARDLVQIIASYKAIVATRMHAGIIAYSLNVPAIGLAWNDKIKFFWTRAGHPENCIGVENMTPENVVEALENTMKKGYNQEHKQKYRQTIKDGMTKIASILV